jgi:hypothetical protein
MTPFYFYHTISIFTLMVAMQPWENKIKSHHSIFTFYCCTAQQYTPLFPIFLTPVRKFIPSSFPPKENLFAPLLHPIPFPFWEGQMHI